MKKISGIILLVSACTIVVLQFQACGRPFEVGGQSMSLTQDSASSIDLKSQALNVFVKNCQSCHDSKNVSGTRFTYADDLNKIAASVFVVPGKPESSQIYIMMAAGTMPIGSLMPSDQNRIIHDWITSLTTSPQPIPTSTPVVVNPTPTPVPGVPTPTPIPANMTPSPTPPMPTFSYIYNKILIGCQGCHGGAGGYGYENYTNTLKSIVKGNPAASPLYTSLNSGRMPKNGTKVTDADLKQIFDWIAAGALNN